MPIYYMNIHAINFIILLCEVDINPQHDILSFNEYWHTLIMNIYIHIAFYLFAVHVCKYV